MRTRASSSRLTATRACLSAALAVATVLTSGIVHAETRAASQTRAVHGTYYLPMPAALSDLASYPMNPATLKIDGSTLFFRYELPEDLVGESHRVMTMTGDVASFESGAFFPLLCHVTGSDA